MVFNKTLAITTLDGWGFYFYDNPNGGATTAYNQYMAHQTIHAYADDENGGFVDTFIPYSSVKSVFITEEKKDSPILDDNCPKEGSACEGISLYYWVGRDPVALTDGEQITIASDTTFFYCTDAPEGEPIPVTATSSNPTAFSVEIVSDDVVGFNLIKGTGANTNITVTVPSHSCSISFSVSDGM